MSTVFRKSAGYSAIRAALLKDPVVSSRIKAFNDAKTGEAQLKLFSTLTDLSMPLVCRALKENLTPPQFNTAKQAIALLNPDEEIKGTEKLFSKYFRSSHQRYESDPFAKLRFVQALPGPIHAVSYSFGATALMNVAALSRVISKGVMLAPLLAWHTDDSRIDITRFFLVLGALDLISQEDIGPGGTVSFPGKTLGSANLAAGLVNRKHIIRAVKRNTEMLCIMAEDDLAIDVKHAIKICKGKLNGRVFLYPRGLKIGHRMTPETGSNYGNSLMEQITSYLISGNVDGARLLIPDT